MSEVLQVKKVSETAIVPEKHFPTDLGYDLFANLDKPMQIDPNQTALVPTGIAVKFPDGWGGFIKDRSGVATKKLLHTVAGVIDENYTGEIKIALINNGFFTNEIKHGDKIAQLVPIQTTHFKIEEVSELVSTDRSDSGFGSSGV